MNTQLSRRDALKSAALAALALPALASSLARAADAPVAPRGKRASPLRLGVAGFTFAKFSVEEVIAALKSVGIDAFTAYKTHVPWSDGTPERCRTIVEKFAAGGITITSTGMIDITTDEAAARRSFENVRAAGLKLFCARQKSEALPLLDKLVKEYDLKVAIHNHGPTEPFPTGLSVWNAIQPFDRRIGLCLDIGHGFRAGEDSAATVRIARERLYEVHLRDTGVRGGEIKDPDATIVGQGLVDVRGVIAALLEIKYPFQAEFEYEKKEDNRIPGLAESIGYVRGLTAALS
jgi:sugar phosphate isomerase/epimerase